MKILIPPSEGKAKVQPSDTLFKDTNFQFAEYTQQIVDYLGLIEYEDLTSVYGTSQEKATMFHRQNQDVFNSKCVPAIERYTGVVYNHIDWKSLSKKAQQYMNNLSLENIKFLLLIHSVKNSFLPTSPTKLFKSEAILSTIQNLLGFT